MGYIYKITNDINNKVYIGKTLASISERWKEHLSDMNKRKNEKRPLYAAMRKYGTSHFYIEEVERCSNDIINERECYWIDFYDSYSNGYNATKGGDGKSYADVESIIDLWNKGKNIKEIHDITGHDHTTITNHLINYGITAEERQKRGRDYLRKAVVMLDKNTDEVLKVFEMVADTEVFLQKPGGRRHVSEVCNGKRKTAYGYKWKYLKDL